MKRLQFVWYGWPAWRRLGLAHDEDREELVAAQKRSFELAAERDRLAIEREHHYKREREELAARVKHTASMVEKLEKLTSGEGK